MDDNPPNVPQARPIENLWTNLSLNVYDKGWQTQTKTQLIRRIRNKLKEFDHNSKQLQTYKKGVRQKHRKIADKRPYSVIPI